MQCECLAVACCQSQSVSETNRQQLVSDIVDSQWRDDNVIQHITNHALAKSNNSAHRKLHRPIQLSTVFYLSRAVTVRHDSRSSHLQHQHKPTLLNQHSDVWRFGCLLLARWSRSTKLLYAGPDLPFILWWVTVYGVQLREETYEVSQYITNNPSQLSLTIPPWVGAMSTSQKAVMLWRQVWFVCVWQVKLRDLLAKAGHIWPLYWWINPIIGRYTDVWLFLPLQKLWWSVFCVCRITLVKYVASASTTASNSSNGCWRSIYLVHGIEAPCDVSVKERRLEIILLTYLLWLETKHSNLSSSLSVC